MAAGPEVPQPGAVNAPYQYTPVETRLNTPMTLQPVDYSAISNALKGLPEAIMNSGLNPKVREQMLAERDRYRLERSTIEDVNKLGSQGRLSRVGAGGEGATITPYWDPVGRMTVPSTDQATGNGQTATGPVADSTNPQPQTNPQQTGDGSTIERTAIPGLPGGVNLGGGQSQSGGAQQFKEPSSPYAPAKPATNIPAAPGGTQPQDNKGQPIGGDIVQNQPSPVGDMLMSQWQDQNAHPVAPVSEALKWAKNNFDTRVQDATYMPHGGPGGQAAYAFHMKGGAINPVPISQMVQNGFAANVAGNNTSMTLSAADKVRQQGQQPPAAPDGQQLAQQQPQDQGQQFPPDQQQYLASKTALPGQGGDLESLAADTTNEFLLKKNYAENQARGDTALAPNTIRDNASNVPRSIIPTHSDPIPQGETPGQQNVAINQQLEQAKKAGLSSLPDGPDGSKLFATTDRGYRWYVDPNPDPNDKDSGLPYLVLNDTPWSQMRMYNTKNGDWTTTEHIRNDRLLDKEIMDKTMQDSTKWTTPDGKPDMPRKITTLRNHYYTTTTTPMDGETGGKLASMRDQVLQSQRVLEATKEMTPDDWGWANRVQNTIADNANVGGTTPAANIAKTVSQFLAPGGMNKRLQYMMNAYAAVKKGAEDPNLTHEERGELDNLTLGTSLADNIVQLNHNRMAEYNRYANQALANKMRISDDYVATANNITNSQRLPDAGMPNLHNIPNTVRPNVQRALPVATPTPAPAGTSVANPVAIKDQASLDALAPPPGSQGIYYRLPDGTVKLRKPNAQPQPTATR